MKVEHEAKLDGNEMSMLRWMCGFNLKNKKNTEIRGLLGLDPVSLTIKRGRLRWFGHVERKDDADWLKRCMKMESEGTRHRKTWWYWIKADMESSGLSHEDAQYRDYWRLESQGGNRLTQVYLESGH